MNTELENDVAESAEQDKPKLNLSVNVKETSACERHVTVSIPRDDIERYFQEKFDELAPNAEVPGFRAGKAPRKLIENRFRDHVEDQVKGALLMDSLAQISDEETFSAISEPDFDFESINVPDDGPMTFEFDIEVRPEFDMPEWKGLKLTQTETKFTDEEVDEEIKRLGSQSGDMVPVDEPAELGDYLVVSLKATHDGKPVSEVSEQLVQLRQKLSFGDGVLENFGELLTGASAGDKKECQIKISDYANNEDLQGANVDLEIELLDVKRVEQVPVEEVAAKIGFEDIEALRELIRNNLDSRMQYTQRQEIRDQISALLTESATWELPQDLLRRQSRRELDRAIIELRSSGFSDQEIQAQENALRQNVLKRTETMLKEHFILERVAEAEEIDATDQDFELEVAKIAAQKNDSTRRVRARLERTGQMDAMRNMIIEQKVIALIEENANIEVASAEKADNKNDVEAIDFFVAGNRPGEDIPEAKYEDGGTETLPNTVKEKD